MEWNGLGTTLLPGHQPSTGVEHKMAYDSDLHQIVLFGGSSNFTTSLGDTWVFLNKLSIGPPANKDACKSEGWRAFNTPRRFKNQGDCIQFVNTGR